MGNIAQTPFTPPALLAYRSEHRIEPVKDWDDDLRGFSLVCRTDGIRVHETAAGYRHDPSEIAELAKVERGERVVQW